MSSGDDSGERNPFAPPPAGAPDQPWRPRAQPRPQTEETGEAAEPSDDDPPLVPPPHPWSPGYRGDGWHDPQQQSQPKSDPNDPVQRHARYALTAGMAGLFCVVTTSAYVGLLLGALAVYWGVGALRAGRTAAGAAGPQPVRPQTPAAIGGLVTGGATVLFVIVLLGLNLVYQNYGSCLDNAATTEAGQSCGHLAPSFWVELTNPGTN